MKKKGSILQIVLIIFLVLLATLLSYASLMQASLQTYKQEELVNKQRETEVILIHYFKKTIMDDILLSDSLIFENSRIKYTVDDMGKYYYIETHIKIDTLEYELDLELNKSSLLIQKATYK